MWGGWTKLMNDSCQSSWIFPLQNKILVQICLVDSFKWYGVGERAFRAATKKLEMWSKSICILSVALHCKRNWWNTGAKQGFFQPYAGKISIFWIFPTLCCENPCTMAGNSLLGTIVSVSPITFTEWYVQSIKQKTSGFTQNAAKAQPNHNSKVATGNYWL